MRRARLRGEIAGGHCKNLFLKDKKGALYLIVCLEDARVDLKPSPPGSGRGRLSFGKPELLMEALGVEPGSVTPFAVINDSARRVAVILDAPMMEEAILNYHPLAATMRRPVSAPAISSPSFAPPAMSPGFWRSASPSCNRRGDLPFNGRISASGGQLADGYPDFRQAGTRQWRQRPRRPESDQGFRHQDAS